MHHQTESAAMCDMTPAVVNVPPATDNGLRGDTVLNRYRTLPIRLPPRPGESLESWLAALAFRHNATWGELLAAVMPARAGNDSAIWVGNLPAVLASEQVASIAATSGVTEHKILAMTLGGNRFPFLRATKRATSILWGPATRQRYCPLCLAESDGCWLLEWQMPWIVVCMRHCCFLRDTCTECGRAFRTGGARFGGGVPLRPRRCRCGFDLSGAPVDLLPAGHPVLGTHHRLRKLLAARTVNEGVYCVSPVDAEQLLADIRFVALRILGAATPQSMVHVLGGRRCAHETQYWRDRLWRSTHGGDGARPIFFAAWAPAPVVAAGISAALTVMMQPSLQKAAAVLDAAAPGPDDARRVRPGRRMKDGYRPSAALSAVEITIRAKTWEPIETLRFCMHSPLPRYPSTPRLDGEDLMTRAVPTMIWPDWAAVLAMETEQRAWPLLRQVLSWLLMEVGSRRSAGQIRQGLQSTANGHRVRRIVAALNSHGHWPDVATALERLGGYLVKHGSPIDYQRRRIIDYSDLLPPDQWDDVCAQAEMVRPGAHLAVAARSRLQERLSGQPCYAHGDIPGGRMYSDYLLRFQTPALNHEIDRTAREFLARQGVTDEPVVWSPPRRRLLHGLKLPGASPSAVVIADLHAALGEVTLRQWHGFLPKAARRLQIGLPVARDLLDEHPMPPAPLRRRNWVQTKEALSDDELRRLYLDDNLSLREIGHRSGIPAARMSERARACGLLIPYRAPCPIPADVIREHHLNRGKTFAEMSADLGFTPQRIRYWAHKYQMPLRPYYSHRPDPELWRHAQRLGIERMLAPALSSRGGWPRLQRFAAASRYANLSQAARAIGCAPQTLRTQCLHLEHALGKTLIIRAKGRYKPMQLTAFGTEIADAVHRLETRLHEAPGVALPSPIVSST
jgi:hypothetical protein